jgi:HAD superfamily hydrolase (TIGR01484 family)
MIPPVIVFDLDETLAESFSRPTPEMARAFAELLTRTTVAITTSASFARLESDFVMSLPSGASFAHLFLFPDSTAQCLSWKDGSWHVVYQLAFTPEQRDEAAHAMRTRLAESGVVDGYAIDGEQIMVRDTQITLAALGVNAPAAAKDAWDPDRSKREKLVALIAKDLPWAQVKIGGRTAVDISPRGVDKSYGILWFSKHLGIPTSDMLYIGDSFYPGGNDSVVSTTGIQTRPVSSPEETLSIIANLLK